MSRLVVDASVAAKWLIDEEDSEAADRLLTGEHQLFAPRLMATEVGHALRRKSRRGKLERSKAGQLAASIPTLAVTWADDKEVIADAVRLALGMECSVYDCVYLALAHQISGTLVTADQRFVNTLAHTEHGGIVITLSEFANASR